MSYNKTTWINRVTEVDADNMNKIENGIVDVSKKTQDLEAIGHAHSNQTVLNETTAAFTEAEKSKLSRIDGSANYYSHPVTHPLSMISYSAKTITGTYSIIPTDTILLCDAQDASFNVMLPSAATVLHPIYFKKIDAGTNTITILGTIDGEANYILELQNEFVQIVSDGTNWHIIAE